jgi:hypothetical protein
VLITGLRDVLKVWCEHDPVQAGDFNYLGCFNLSFAWLPSEAAIEAAN